MKSDSNFLSPKGEFWNRLERALDLLKNVSKPAKSDLGNSPRTCDIEIKQLTLPFLFAFAGIPCSLLWGASFSYLPILPVCLRFRWKLAEILTFLALAGLYALLKDKLKKDGDK